MSDIERLPASPRHSTEYEALVAAAPNALNAIPGAVYLCDSDGRLVRYNAEAAELWGRAPRLDEAGERFCGSHRLYRLDGTPLPHAECPMAVAVRAGTPTRDAEVVVERPDGSRITALVNIRPLRDHQGNIQGAINCFQDITARKALEGDLVRKSRDLEDFFENGAVGLHIVSGEGIILRANKAELDLLGYTAEEYVGRHIAEFHVDPPVLGDILQRLSCGDRLDRYPARLRAKDGSIRHVLITSNGRFEQGRLVNTRCFTTDVTGLRAAEAARRESEERLAATYEAATVGIAETDEAGRYLRVNDALCEILGRSREALLAASLAEITHEDDRDEDAALYARQVRGELASYTARKRSRRPDGSIVYLDVFSSSVRDEGGRFRYGVRVLQDVTEQQRMQDQIRESERRMRELLEALPAAVYTTDAAGRVTFYNEAAVRLAGRRPELGSDSWCVTWRLYRPDGTPLPHDQCPMALALKEGRAVRGEEAVAERPDGSRVPFIPFPTPLRDETGALVGAVNMLVDITERKRAEEQQRLLLAELSHRVKNTLATVQAIARQTLLRAKDPADFVASFTGRLQALARAHTLLTQSSWRGADLAALVREQLLLDGGGRDERIACAGPEVVLAPEAALHLALVLHELGTNARKYGALSVPGGRLSVEWAVEAAEGRVLRLRWAETGGPPVSASSAPGFGTVLIERSVKAHGGRTRMLSEAAGVSWEIELPLPGPFQDALDPRSSAGAAGARKAARRDGRGAEGPADMAGRRVLVVEDEPIVALDIASGLAEAGITIIGPAETVEEAARLIETARLDAALLDANLGGQPVDGLAAALTRRNVPFAFVTGYGRESLPGAFRGAAMVAKPFTSGELVVAVGQLLSREDAAADILPLRGRTPAG